MKPSKYGHSPCPVRDRPGNQYHWAITKKILFENVTTEALGSKCRDQRGAHGLSWDLG
ncbi:hypothetical protein SERLADRAFT_469807 [Serpula lacrymans var. lacrymans S7.9]|uniref:Uncharacterized protein n=1 Tax=Serpula lacrymans var. lacrymans (strain S7.9) TaxID=578457 RepID=F8NYH6_SERL9|nr:uncharacterized protein SERLADRAFT_469807 [Serpula lacrymans var. lacrymans S7.9]EGO23647.1 hypothetical protein SERLADRAFT_469807 [Serpula lacrymans var. lacrymans S7.9]